MKPRTAKDRVVEDLTARFIKPGNLEAHKRAAIPHVYLMPPRARKVPSVWCACCGGIIEAHPEVNVLREDIVCPHCGAKLHACSYNVGNKRIVRDFSYTMQAEVVGDWQVLRYFETHLVCTYGQPIQVFEPVEIVRRWYNVKHGGRPVVWSRRLSTSWYSRNFCLDSALELRDEGQRYRFGYYVGSTYRVDLDAGGIIPGSRWHKDLKRDGMRGEGTLRRLGIQAYEAPQFFTTPHLVTLFKRKEFAVASTYFSLGTEILEKDWPSILVALRRGYKIQDARTWHDYLDNLRELGLDTRSPRYICPDKLRLEHARLVDRLHEQRERIRRAEEAKQILKDSKKYAKKVSPFLDVQISGVGVYIAIIPTLADVQEEGAKMHHCVFENKYYNVDTSLLFSARDKNTGKRAETIEFDLKTGTVLQSRAACNKMSKHHDEILQLMAGASQGILQRAKKILPSKFGKTK